MVPRAPASSSVRASASSRSTSTGLPPSSGSSSQRTSAAVRSASGRTEGSAGLSTSEVMAREATERDGPVRVVAPVEPRRGGPTRRSAGRGSRGSPLARRRTPGARSRLCPDRRVVGSAGCRSSERRQFGACVRSAESASCFEECEQVFDMLPGWASTTPTSPGARSSDGCPIGRADPGGSTPPPSVHSDGGRRIRWHHVAGPVPIPATVATARPGRRTARPTSHPTTCRAGGARRAGNTHRVRRAALPLDLQLPRRRLARPRSWSRRPPGWASRPWPSPTTTASTGWCASPRRPGRSALPTVFGAELTLGSDAARSAGRPTPTGATCWSWPATRPATPGWPRAISEAQMAGEKGGPARASPTWPRRRRAGPGATGWCSPVAARARCPRPWSSAARRPPTGSCGRWSPPSGASTPSSSCGTTATRSTRARNDALAELAVPAGVQAVATNNVHYATPADRRLATALAAVRARRSLDEHRRLAARRRPAPTCAPGAEQARRFARYPGVGRRRRRAGPELRLRPAARRPRAAAVPVPAGPDGHR